MWKKRTINKVGLHINSFHKKKKKRKILSSRKRCGYILFMEIRVQTSVYADRCSDTKRRLLEGADGGSRSARRSTCCRFRIEDPLCERVRLNYRNDFPVYVNCGFYMLETQLQTSLTTDGNISFLSNRISWSLLCKRSSQGRVKKLKNVCFFLNKDSNLPLKTVSSGDPNQEDQFFD